MLGGRAGAEAEPHARAHEIERPGGGGTLELLGVHRHRDDRLWGAEAGSAYLASIDRPE
jgi:hypothetical protein